jgi:hypothetical protein
MKKYTKSAAFLILACAFLLVGCVSVSPQEIASADFGPKPGDYEERVKKFMGSVLKDPMSAVYEFRPTLRKGVVMGGLPDNFAKHYGWVVIVSINAKNSFGGYTGAKTYYIMLVPDGRAADITERIQGGFAALVD